MAQLNQMVEQLTGALNESNETIKQKRLELESKERIEFAKLETQLELEKLKQAQAFALESVNRPIAELQARQEMVGINEPINFSNQEFNGAGMDQPSAAEFSPQPDSMAFDRGTQPPMGDM